MSASPKSRPLRSKVCVYDLAVRTSRVIFEQEGIVEAPNWSRDGRSLLVNHAGGLFRLALDGARTLDPIRLEPGAYECNNDHDFSADGELLAFSASGGGSDKSRVFVAGADGSGVRLLTPAAPSYFHGWSPDGRWLAFVAERGDGRFELYRIRVDGGHEERLTSTGGYDDGPEYAPDASFIYFNSNRGGRWNIWRMPVEGAGVGDARAEQVTRDEKEDWFPHISPDGRWLLFLSFPAGTLGHDDRMPGMQLRLSPVPGQRIEPAELEVLAEFSGGQGSLNVNSWAPDSKQFAYVVYEAG